MDKTALKLNEVLMARTIFNEIAETANRHPNKIALTLIGPGRKEETTYGGMLAQIFGLASHLFQEEIRQGDRVIILGENHPQWSIAYFGALACGGVAVPLDPAGSIDALANFLDKSEAKAAFVSAGSLDRFKEVCEQTGHRIRIILMNSQGQPAGSSNGLVRFEDWARNPVTKVLDQLPVAVKTSDMAVLMFTSGTTGFPKAVPLTHGNIYSEAIKIQDAMHISADETALGLLPLFHVYSQIVSLWLLPMVGGRVVFVTDMNTAAIEHALKEAEVTALIGVPRLWYLFHKKIFETVSRKPGLVRLIFRFLLTLNGRLRDSVGINLGRVFFKQVHDGFGGRLRLTVSGGASFDPLVARDFHRLGFTLLQGYGLTETCGAATITRFEDNVIGSVGSPLHDVNIRIDEPDADGAGEVLIRGPIVTPGYYENPEANHEAFTEDGWFRTGDLGRLDKGGHLFIVGRKKDVIKLPSGKNVFPEDVEAHYGRSSMVSEICILGVRDPSQPFERAEKLIAVVVPDFDYLKSQHIANSREAIRFELDNLGRDLPEYQRVRDYIIRADPLPRTTTRKIKRFEVQKLIETSSPELEETRERARFAKTPEDQALLDSPSGRVVSAAIRKNISDSNELHPRMNLELDLGMDSLARAETLIIIEKSIGSALDTELAAEAHTISELIELVKISTSGASISGQATEAINWREILNTPLQDSSVLEPILKNKTLLVWPIYLLLRLIYVLAKIIFRLEVSGQENLRALKRPYLVAPNHQSYLDPILICAAYPPEVLMHIFHVGASEYFVNPLMRSLARLLNIIPVDPELNLLRALRAGAAGLRAGKILNIYPEGQRSFDGMLQEFKDGASILAMELDLKIVPVAIDGAFRAWPRKSKRIHLSKIRIRFGQPLDLNAEIPMESQGDERYAAATALLKSRIQEMLEGKSFQ